MQELRCKVCRKPPCEISEYIVNACLAKISPDEYVRKEELSLNPQTGLFYCTSCFIKIGMPYGKA
ncbi:hypothetical protein DL346_03475 [Paenibacillus montanisoli]|uniref:Uncharacterized protein n=1 Tax=Paenibacillus montanisoli TaxID=2081970 RepID=A0A328U821_9BACL|nr:hypothetical protein DL346_03475 [Paenibacillus montanisoli]